MMTRIICEFSNGEETIEPTFKDNDTALSTIEMLYMTKMNNQPMHFLKDEGEVEKNAEELTAIKIIFE